MQKKCHKWSQSGHNEIIYKDMVTTDNTKKLSNAPYGFIFLERIAYFTGVDMIEKYICRFKDIRWHSQYVCYRYLSAQT
jgi:hypothetical protein